MTIADFEDFARLMYQTESVCIKRERPLSNIDINFYFELLKDKSFAEIKENVIFYLKTAKEMFFPSIAVMGGLQRKQLEARKYWERINYYIREFYFQELGTSILKIKLQQNHETHLWPLIQRWGTEIINTTAKAATRKLFLESIEKEKDIVLLLNKDNEKKQLQ